MRQIFKIGIKMFALVAMSTLTVDMARARDGSERRSDRSFSLAVTLGEVVYFIDGDTYRGPVSLEVVPSFGWPSFKFDLGISTTLESIHVGDENFCCREVFYWNFSLRPGARVTPPMIPLYLRFAIPLILQQDGSDWGLMFGVGADFRISGILGLVLELDTTLSKDLEWGGNGVPLEFRGGLSFHF